jgi:hypothetical protein
MYPNPENVGVVLEPADIPLVEQAFLTANKFEGSAKAGKGKDVLILPSPTDEGEVVLDERLALEVETYAVIGLRTLTSTIRSKNYEFDARLLSSDPMKSSTAAEVEAELVGLEAKAIMLKGLKVAVEGNLERSIQQGSNLAK